MRTRNAVKNSTASLVFNFMAVLIGLITQKVFINTLGTVYLGITGILGNIVAVFGLIELGLSSAIYYALYQPLKHNNYPKIKSILDFYKNAYKYISIAVIVIGFLILPFLKIIIGNIKISSNITIIYILFVLDALASYLILYMKSLLYADQKNYVIEVNHMINIFFLNLAQILILILTKNFYLFMLLKITMRLTEAAILKIITKRKYSNIYNCDATPLDNKEAKKIIKRVKGLAFHKLGGYLVLSSDNIVISIFLGVATVGLYSNYYIVITALILIFWQSSTAITASVGNLLLDASLLRKRKVYKRISFINYIISVFVFTSFVVLMNGFVTIWLGNEYILSNLVLWVLAINLFLTLIRAPIMNYKEASGIFHSDRKMPFYEAGINLVFSLLFLHYLGLAGVFLGTTISILFLHLYSYPKYVLKEILLIQYQKYFVQFLKNIILAIFIALSAYVVSRLLVISNAYTDLVVDFMICILIPFLIFSIVFKGSDELNYFKLLLKSLIKDILKKVKYQ